MAPSWAPSGSDDTDERTGPSLDDRPRFGGVSETHRRERIVSLVEGRPHRPYTVGELTVALSEWFQDETTGMVPTDEEIHSTLYDFDLPRLDAADRLVFERETGRVFATTAEDGTRRTAATEQMAGRHGRRTDSPTAHGVDNEAPNQEIGHDGVSKARVVELGVLLVGVAGVALAASSVSPFDSAYTLVPVAVAVLFFGYRAVTRW